MEIKFNKRFDSNISELFIEIHHFGSIVVEMDSAVEMYCNIFGMKLERDTGPQGLEPHYADFVSKVTGIKCSNTRIVYLKGFDIRIELLQFYDFVNHSIFKPLNIQDQHIAFIVRDTYAAYEVLKNKGFKFISEPLEIPEGPNKGSPAVYFEDLHGYRFELIEKRKNP